MAVLRIRKLGDPVLREKARPVERFDGSYRRLVDDMFETMYAAPGVGLAAPQVGVSLRLFVYDDGEGNTGAVANPELSELENEESRDEGCLSIPAPSASPSWGTTPGPFLRWRPWDVRDTTSWRS